MIGDGDGWVHCAAGHQHWGRFGAAGLLVSDGHRAILQHRAPWTHEGGRWSLPGGARDSHEDPISTALREAGEEAAIAPTSIDPTALWVDDHGGWSYTTVLARPIGEIKPHAANAESTEVSWRSYRDIAELALHHGLAATWPRLHRAASPLVLAVDGRATTELGQRLADDRSDRARLYELARHGIDAGALPASIDTAGASVLLPHLAIVGMTPELALTPPDISVPDTAWWRRSITTAAGLNELLDEVGLGVQIVVVSDAADWVGPVSAFGVISPVGTVDPHWFVDQLRRQASG